MHSYPDDDSKSDRNTLVINNTRYNKCYTCALFIP